jgi:transposase
MGFRHVGHDMKESALVLQGRGYDNDQISDILGISVRSIQRWSHNFDTYSSVQAPRSIYQGRPPTFHATITRDLHILLTESPDMYLDEIRDWLAVARDVRISRTALHNHLKGAGISFKKLRKVAVERDEEFRTH